MNRFLKKEWDDTEIPEQVYTQTRNRAWAALEQKPRRAPVKIVCALAATLALFLVIGVSLTRRDISDRHRRAVNLPTVSPTAPTASYVKQGGSAVERGKRMAISRQPSARRMSDSDGHRLATRHALPREDGHDPAAATNASALRGHQNEAGAVIDTPTNSKTDSPDRIVLNFQLPTSGVRMIWILDKNFHPDGGTE